MSKIMQTALAFIFVTFVTMVPASCNKRIPDPWESMNLTSIEVSPPRLSIYVNDTSSKLAVSAIRSQVGSSSGSSKAVTNNLTFKSSDEQIATVSSAGQVTGVTPGTANVTISYTEGNTTQTVILRVTVTPVPGT